MIYYIGDDDEKADIVSCASNVASTVQGTMPFMRDMGIPGDMSGNVIDQEAYLEANLIEQIEEWEERAIVEQVVNRRDSDGAIKQKVVIRRNVESD